MPDFHGSASNIWLDGSVLKAQLYNEDGEAQDAEIDLNDIIGNDEGSFSWDGVGFAGSAEDISFSLEGDDGTPILRARLLNSEGEYFDADVNLAERLGNSNGEFSFE